MEILPFIFWWSLIGIIPYQLLVLRPWVKSHKDEIWISDLLKTLLFGLIAIMAAALITVFNINKIKIR